MAAKNAVVTFHQVPSATWFRNTLQTIGRLFRFANVDEVDAFLHGDHPLRSSCLVSFDDGDRSFRDVALPVLQELSIPALLFVSPAILAANSGYWFQELGELRRRLDAATIRRTMAEQLDIRYDAVTGFAINSLAKQMPLADLRQVIEALQGQSTVTGSTTDNLSLDEVRDLSQLDLITIGAHTMHHAILRNESREIATREIDDSIDTLAELTGQPIRTFAYPNGVPGVDFSDREQRALREKGVTLAFATHSGFLGPKTDPLAIPRIAMSATPADTGSKVMGKLLLAPFWDKLRNQRELEQRRRIAVLLAEQGQPQ
ncbi:MAG: polysaccharide deacetylase family protein [Chloroflexota bacterium]|nr:polysaccharide deacetylase family protein [Chloroflexota bacterium]